MGGSSVFLLLLGALVVWLAMSGKFQAMMAVVNGSKGPKSP